MRRILEIKSGDEGEIIFTLTAPKGLPEPTQEHLRTASREALLALRSLLDEAIERLEMKKGSEGTRKIDIQ
jgi:hypothetical protein